MKPLVAIVVAFESDAVLPACLAALKAEQVPAIVVDNASSDNSIPVAVEYGATAIQNAKNEGFGRGMNIGVRAAEGFEHVLILNPDAVMQPGSVASLLAAQAKYPDAGLLGPRIVGPDDDIFFPIRSLLSPYLQNDKKAPCVPAGDACAPFLSGACYLIRRDLFLRLGGFDPNIFLFYEDNDLCRRVIDAGHSIVYVHDAIVSHAQGKSSKPVPGRKFKTRWHYAWSEGYVARKYGLPDPGIKTVLRNGLKYLGSLLTGKRDRQERYGGAAAGAIASMRNCSALKKEGLD